MYYVNARYYSPDLGRFLQTDPLGLAGGANLYTYGDNDPLNIIDPTGLWGFGLVLSGSGELGIAFGGGASGSLGAGVFWGGPPGLNAGAFSSFGGFVGGTSTGWSYPTPLPGGTTAVGGSYLGAGVGGYFTNATNVGQLSGPFNVYSLNTPIGSFQLGISGGTFILSVTCGVPPCGIGGGASGSTYPTNTWSSSPPPK